jgi:hypothetical protein
MYFLFQDVGQPRESPQLVPVSTTICTTTLPQHLFGCKRSLRKRAYFSVLVAIGHLPGSRLGGHTYQLPLEAQNHQTRRTPVASSRVHLLRPVARLSRQWLCQLHPHNRQICPAASLSPVRSKDTNDFRCCRYIHCRCLRRLFGSRSSVQGYAGALVKHRDRSGIIRMGCCGSREREGESIPTIDEETDVPAEIARNLKDVPEEGSYPTSSDEEQNIVPHDRRPRLSLIPIITDINNDAARIAKNGTQTPSAGTLASTDIIDAHMGVQRADSISTDRRRSQWEAVALGIAAKRRSQDMGKAPENSRRVSWSPSAGSPGRKHGAINEHGKERTPHKNKCLADLGTCPAAQDTPQRPSERFAAIRGV